MSQYGGTNVEILMVAFVTQWRMCRRIQLALIEQIDSPKKREWDN